MSADVVGAVGRLEAAAALAGLVTGFVHVLSGPDHLAAIAPYAVDGKRKAWRMGFHWGLGHSAGVLGVGSLALLFRDLLLVDALSGWGERCVGVVLVAIGMRGLRLALSGRRETAQARQGRQAQVHGHAAFGVGVLHGLAGSSHLLGIVPALALPSGVMGAAFLLMFGTGSVVGMGAFASVIGSIANSPSVSSARTQAALLGLCSAVAVAVGIVWISADAWSVLRPELRP